MEKKAIQKDSNFEITNCDLKTMPVENLIHTVRGFPVMLDSDLVKLYGIDTKDLNQGVKRNISRFPKDFMFRLSKEEF